MAPNCPEEIDVFSIPHSRMKELVQKYLIMVSEINFADTSHLTNLLENLVNTFKEFKAHEHIENKYIMKKLKEKLKTLSIRSTALCNCHSDNRLTDMLELVQDGYKCTQKTEIDRNNFGRKLRKALEEFTEKFIPHMEEEEEVFQPMLIKYFTFDELREIKCKVLEKHFCCSDKCVKAKLLEKTEFALSDSSDEECSEKLELTKDNQVQTTDRNVIDRVPDEVTIKIFTYLNPQELGRCAQVSQHWNRLALDGSLWRNFLPVMWSKGDWSFVSSMHVEEEEEKLLQNENSWDEIIIDEDADVDESGENDNIELVHQIKKEADMLTCMMKYLLPRIGRDIKTINLAYSKGLVNGLLYKILSLCPLVENLDLTHTRVSDLGFKSLGKNGCGSLLKKIDLTGCHNITDVTLERLSKALNSVPVVRHYEIEEEKNEIESNEKGMKSKNMDDTCHSTCMQDLNTSMIDNVCNKTSNVQSMNDIEDHFQMNSFKKPISFANQFTNYVKIVADCSGEDNCDVDEISPKLTFNDGVILSANKNSTNCCSQTNGQESSCLKHYTENVFCKHLDADEQKTIKSNGIDCENICDKLNCGLEFLNLSGCFLITDRGIRALVENLTFPQLRYLDLSGCDQLTSDSLTELVSVCTLLDHQFLYYCDNITEDPYFDSASGCQNLECPTRSCCRTSY